MESLRHDHGVAIGERVEASPHPDEMRAPLFVVAGGREAELSSSGRLSPLDGADAARDAGSSSSAPSSRSSGPTWAPPRAAPSGRPSVTQEPTQFTFEIEEPRLGVERLIGGVVEGDTAAERALGCPSRCGPSRRSRAPRYQRGTGGSTGAADQESG